MLARDPKRLVLELLLRGSSRFELHFVSKGFGPFCSEEPLQARLGRSEVSLLYKFRCGTWSLQSSNPKRPSIDLF